MRENQLQHRDLVIYNVKQYEGFLLGKPEVEIHAFAENGAWISCAGERFTSFDQNSDIWTGRVRVATLPNSPIDPGGYPLHFQMWEDDWGACDFINGSFIGKPRPSPSMASWLGTMVGVLGVLLAGNQGEAWWFALSLGIAIVYATSFNADDFIGFVVPMQEGCWQRAEGPEPFRLVGRYADAGWIELDFVGIERSGPVCPTPTPPPPPPFAVQIAGPNEMQPYATCLFTAVPSGGTEPYSYTWAGGGTGPFAYYSAGASDIGVSVLVVDGNGRQGYADRVVSVHHGAPECLDM